jgi:hypothetical protein
MERRLSAFKFSSSSFHLAVSPACSCRAPIRLRWMQLAPSSTSRTALPHYRTRPEPSAAIWDDLSAVFDVTGSLTNQAALQSRATQRGADYFRQGQDDHCGPQDECAQFTPSSGV